jgi:superfamily I DNA/RNA helicase
MIWADALPTVFENFKDDFGAQELNLLINHRSAPLLIDLQCRIYNTLNNEQISITPDNKWAEDGLAFFHTFKTQSDEARYIKERIVELLNAGVNPRDVCIITKHSVSKYCCELFGELPGTECAIRDENEYQDLLNEDLVKILYSAMICSQETRPEAFIYLNDMEYAVNGVNVENESQAKLALTNLGILIENVKETFGLVCASDEEAIERLSAITDGIVSHYGKDRIKSTFPQYGGGTYFQKIKEKFINFLHAEYRKCSNWKEALKSFEGEMAVPCMTIHKSKGLEFDTVFFIALEDGSFFSFDRQRDEDICALFVGISRAERELHLAYSHHRDVLFSRNGGHQSTRKIREITEALKNSNCLELDDQIHQGEI